MTRTRRLPRTGIAAIDPNCRCESCTAPAKPSDRRRADAATVEPDIIDSPNFVTVPILSGSGWQRVRRHANATASCEWLSAMVLPPGPIDGVSMLSMCHGSCDGSRHHHR